MAKTAPADYIGKENLGYVLVALASEGFRERISDVQKELSAELPGIIWPMPPEQLHITLCEIIQPKEYSEDKEALFRQWRGRYGGVPAEILSGKPRLNMVFTTIEASPQAIIVKASDPGAFNAIRASLVEHMQLPAETRMPPDIAHSSIARYVSSVDLKKVQAAVAKLDFSAEEEITEFHLLKTTVMPLQEYEILDTIPLTNGESY